MKISSGLFRGKKINFNNKKFGDADITSQKVKGAVFSMMGENLANRSFLDVFGGSGQMTYEAISRSASYVVINELNKARYLFIKSFIDSLSIESNVEIYNKKWNFLLSSLKDMNKKFDIIFLDPPYIKDGSDSKIYSNLLIQLDNLNLLSEIGKIYVQHFTENELEEKIGNFGKINKKKYGTTTVSVYSHRE